MVLKKIIENYNNKNVSVAPSPLRNHNHPVHAEPGLEPDHEVPGDGSRSVGLPVELQPFQRDAHPGGAEPGLVLLAAVVGVGLIEDVPDRQLRVSNLFNKHVGLFRAGRDVFAEDDILPDQEPVVAAHFLFVYFQAHGPGHFQIFFQSVQSCSVFLFVFPPEALNFFHGLILRAGDARRVMGSEGDNIIIQGKQKPRET